MRFQLRRLSLCLTAVTALVTGVLPSTTKAQTYPIDCAILLCLSGGWPASVPCSRARAEFIRRITPWPVEPPLQIWRCPMGASYETERHPSNVNRIFEAFLQGEDYSPRQSFPGDDVAVQARSKKCRLALFRNRNGCHSGRLRASPRRGSVGHRYQRSGVQFSPIHSRL